MGVTSFKSGHHIELLLGGEQFFPSLIAAIDACCREVRLETYIFHFDASGNAVAQSLVRAAQRGIRVYLVMDGAGTTHVPANWIQLFTEAGICWQQYSPIGTFGYLIPMRWRRLHRKLCVIDQNILFCGGINILNDFEDPNHGTQKTPRFDFAVKVQGPLVQDAHRLMLQFWTRMQLARNLQLLKINHARQTLLQTRQISSNTVNAASDSMQAAFVLRDNFLHRTHIERAYRKAIGEAQKEVLIANAYFLPGRKIRNALIHAAKRGVQVRLLLHGRYEYFMQYHASRPVYSALLSAGVQIYEYSGGFLHAKVAVIDERWATVGSSNLDPLSLLLAREANIVVQNPLFASTLRNKLQEAIQTNGVLVRQSTFSNRPWGQKVLDFVAYGLMRLSLFVMGQHY